MEKSIGTLVMQIKQDENLRPYFVDYIGENLKTAFDHVLSVRTNAAPRFEEIASVKFEALLNKLEHKVPEQHLEQVVAEVCKHYAAMVHLTFRDQPFTVSNHRIGTRPKYLTTLRADKSKSRQK
jgi:hypothetical protein